MKAIVVYESLWGNTAAIARAIAATGAPSTRDAGRAMAWLVREHPGWDDRAALHTRLCQHLPPPS